jgi:hypothetical protein
MNDNRILLFISRESAVYDFIRRQVELACSSAGRSVDIEVIDIAEKPELAEEHNIEALPTFIVGQRRFIGTPSPEMLSTCLGLAPPAGK